MEQLTKSSKLKRVDVMIVVLICLFVFLLMLAAIYKVRSTYYRMRCGTNLSLIGMAMLIYSNDYYDKFPRAGGENSVWSNAISNWLADDRNAAYYINQEDDSDGSASITSSFYLLVKHAEASPKIFICPGDKGTTVFKPADYGVVDKEFTALWDFGPPPIGAREHCSYSYHMPYGLYPLTTSSEPGMAVAADPNPWIGSPSSDSKGADLFAQFNPDAGRDAVKIGNAITHKEDGQNVLFMDIHVGFEKASFCGIDDDNIYTYWNGGDIRRGGLPLPGASEPSNRLDSFLVNDGRVAIGPKPTLDEINR